MIGTSASGITRGDDESVATAVIARWLHLAAAPTFAVMALSTLVLDSGPPNAFCAGAGGSGSQRNGADVSPDGALSSAPWLKLMSRRS